MNGTGTMVEGLEAMLNSIGIETVEDLKGLEKEKMDDLLIRFRVEGLVGVQDDAEKQEMDSKLVRFEKEWQKLKDEQ